MSYSRPNHNNTHVELMFPDSYYCCRVRKSVISHPPPHAPPQNGAVLCRNYKKGDPSSCSRGSACRFVHVEMTPEELVAAKKDSKCHVNYLWKNTDMAIYPRMDGGQTLPVFGPNMREPVEMVESATVFATKGSLVSVGGKYSHCAHFFFNRLCLRGADCNFVHRINVDPNAQDFQRAPVQHLPPMGMPSRSAAPPPPPPQQPDASRDSAGSPSRPIVVPTTSGAATVANPLDAAPTILIRDMSGELTSSRRSDGRRSGRISSKSSIADDISGPGSDFDSAADSMSEGGDNSDFVGIGMDDDDDECCLSPNTLAIKSQMASTSSTGSQKFVRNPYNNATPITWIEEKSD